MTRSWMSLRLAVIAVAVATTGMTFAQRDFVPVTDAMLRDPDPADWLMWRRTADSWGYSPLDDIDRRNVARLTLAWSVDLDEAPSQEGIPLVYDGVLYFPSPMDVTTAFDAATGKQLWQHRRALPADLGQFVPFPQTNRNLAIYGRLIIDNGADDFIYALDALTGEQVWETKILDYKTYHVKQGSAPLVANGVLIAGRNCQPNGGPDACIITGHDARTGKELWRKRTIPKPGEPGGDSWGDVPDDKRWHVGAWMIPSYDAALDLVYVGTSVTAPAPKFMLAGNDKQYLYHNSTLALRPATGETVWYYQHAVDHWDLDHPFERMLIDTAVAPDPSEVPWINPRLRPRRSAARRDGHSRQDGARLHARSRNRRVPVGAAHDRPERDRAHRRCHGRRRSPRRCAVHGAGPNRLICPTTNGGKNWPAGAYSPRTKTMYFAMANTCAWTTSVAGPATPEMLYAINTDNIIAPDAGGKVGTLRALSVETGKAAWRYDQRAALMALLATGGDLVFGGDVAGTLHAFDAETGEVLWETSLGAQVTGHPVTFAVDGRQYVAVSTGRSNMTGGLARLTPEVVPGDSANKLFVFALLD